MTVLAKERPQPSQVGLAFGRTLKVVRVIKERDVPAPPLLKFLAHYSAPTPFGISDPIFSRDIGYYVFTLPGLSLLIGDQQEHVRGRRGYGSAPSQLAS